MNVKAVAFNGDAAYCIEDTEPTGVVYDYIKNTVFNAHNFFDTKTTKKAPLNFNQWGFTLGGPVIIPKLYNGRNKTFFFGSYEKLNQKAQSFLDCSPFRS